VVKASSHVAKSWIWRFCCLLDAGFWTSCKVRPAPTSSCITPSSFAVILSGNRSAISTNSPRVILSVRRAGTTGMLLATEELVGFITGGTAGMLLATGGLAVVTGWTGPGDWIKLRLAGSCGAAGSCGGSARWLPVEAERVDSNFSTRCRSGAMTVETAASKPSCCADVADAFACVTSLWGWGGRHVRTVRPAAGIGTGWGPSWTSGRRWFSHRECSPLSYLDYFYLFELSEFFCIFERNEQGYE